MIIDAPLYKQVKKSESIWCLETGKDGKKMLQISLTKKIEEQWECAFEGDTKIKLPRQEIHTAADLKKLAPDNRKFLEQMMHKEQQKMKNSGASYQGDQIRELEVPNRTESESSDDSNSDDDELQQALNKAQ